ncbi:MAG: carboxypeptidase-like regulatory domain-containing protein [Acidobacteriota bacterium]
MTRRIAPLVLLALALPAWASGNATVRIFVRDAKGQPVADASVRLVIKDTWHKHERTTGKDGRVVFHALPAAEFRITVDRKEFQVHTDSRDCLRVPPSGTLEMTVVLRAADKAAASAKDEAALPCPTTTPSSEVATSLSSREYRAQPKRK